eukprot:scaffold70281_cov67-Cyclotella_meneghiniana.AAC.13
MSTGNEIHIGTPAADFEHPKSFTFHFHDFKNLPNKKGLARYSPRFSCAGFEWYLDLYAGGNIKSAEGYIAVLLHSTSEVLARFEIILKKSDGSDYIRHKCTEEKLFGKSGWGSVNFVGRQTLFDESNKILKSGTMTLVVRILPNKDYYFQSTKPQRTLSDNIFKFFGDENSSDVAFKVKRNVFRAHKLILKAIAPELAELAEQFNLQTPMPIQGVEPAIFEMMLKSLYGRSIPASTWKEHSKQILDAAGKYGFTALRAEAEGWHVKNLKLTVDNAIDQLLHADGTHCLLLKRAVIDYIVDNGQAVLASPSFAGLVESPELMKEIMVELAKSNESRKRKLGD